MRSPSKKRIKDLLVVVSIATSATIPARADFDEQRAAVKAYAMQALDAYKVLGPEAAAADFMKPKKWAQGPDHFSLHLGLATNDEMVLADSGFPEFVGISYDDVDDLDGMSLGKAITRGITKAPSGVLLSHRFPDPSTKGVAHAEGYCMRADEQHVLCAWSQSLLR